MEERKSSTVRPLAFRHPVLRLGGRTSSPLVRLRPFLLGDLPLQVRNRPWERHRACSRLVRVTQPFHPTGVWLLRCSLYPLVGFLVAGDPLVCWSPPDFDGDARPGLSQHGDVLPLAWSAYCWPGPGSSEVIRLMVAWASVKIVTRSDVVCLPEADSSALARAAHSAS